MTYLLTLDIQIFAQSLFAQSSFERRRSVTSFIIMFLNPYRAECKRTSYLWPLAQIHIAAFSACSWHATHSSRARSLTRSSAFSSKHSNHQSPVCRGQVHRISVRVNMSLHRAARRQANKNFWCDETCSMDFFLRHSRQEWLGYSEISTVNNGCNCV